MCFSKKYYQCNYYLITLCLWLSAYTLSYAQDNSRIQKLLQSLDTAKGVYRVPIYNRLAYEYAKSDLKKAFTYVDKAFILANKLNYQQGVAQTYDLYGSVYEHKGDYPTALEYKIKASNLYQKIGALSGYESCLNNIGVFFYRQKNYTKALEYYQRALEIAIKRKDEEHMATYQLNIGEVYHELGEHNKAIEMQNKVIKISEPLNIKDNIAFALGIIGKAHSAKGKHTLALQYMQQSLAIFRGLEDTMSEIEYLVAIAKVYLKTNQLGNALRYAQEAEKIAYQFSSKEWLKEVFMVLTKIHQQRQEIMQAFEYQNKYILLKDSLMSYETQRKMLQLQTLYESETKENKIKILTQEKQLQQDTIERQQFTRNTIIAGAFLMLFIIFILFRNNRQKQKTNQFILQQKQEIEIKNIELANKNSDITASITYAQRIQKAMLPPKNLLDKYFQQNFILFLPKDIVSGDFYFFVELDNPHNPNQLADAVILAVIDCTGHGVPGAFMSILANDMLTEIIIYRNITEPAEVLYQLHKAIRNTLRQNETQNRDGMEIGIVKWQRTKQICSFAGARQNLLYLQNNELFFVKGDRVPIGGEQHEKERLFTKHEIPLNQTITCFYLFSDGFQDQFGSKESKKFGSANFKNLIKNIHQLPFEEQGIQLEQTLQAWKGTHRQTDDITVLGWQVVPTNNP